jgi:hypothetical protein
MHSSAKRVARHSDLPLSYRLHMATHVQSHHLHPCDSAWSWARFRHSVYSHPKGLGEALELAPSDIQLRLLPVQLD